MGRRLLGAHPLFAAAAPILLLACANIAKIQLWVLWIPLTLSLLGTAAIWGVQWVIRRDATKAAVGTSLLVTSFFSYGHLVNVLDTLPLLGASASRALAIVSWLLIFLAAELLLRRSSQDVKQLSHSLGVMALLLCLLPAVRLAYTGCTRLGDPKLFFNTPVPLSTSDVRISTADSMNAKANRCGA